MNISELPVGSAPKALLYAHFPAPWLGVVWRNWNRIHPARIAEVLKTTEQEIVSAASKMGLIRNDSALQAYRDRGFLTILRYNWQLLDYPQLIQLLGWTPEQMENVLLNEDFMYIKLGCEKPQCGEVLWHPLAPAEEQRLTQIRQLMQETNADLPSQRETPFDFSAHIGKRIFTGPPTQEHLKMIYSYFAVYGDILLPEAPDPFPEDLLRDYASSGINAVWLPAILHQLIPWLGKEMPLSTRCEERLSVLNRLIRRCAKYGIKVYLYLNEPRGIPDRIKIEHEEWRSIRHTSTGCLSFCPWAPGMLEALSSAMEQLCCAVPELGGIFTINQSEYMTHCLSRAPEKQISDDGIPIPTVSETDSECPVCAKHSIPENITVILNAMYEGIRRSGNAIRLLAYTWNWRSGWDCEIAGRIPKEITILSVSETEVKTDCFGIPGTVYDYSISKVGPGKLAENLWKHSAATGHRTAAKIQANTSWEMGGVPVIPVPTLVEEHLNRIRACGVQDFMVSWTLGGYPGGNLELLDHTAEELAQRDFGTAAPQIMTIYRAFGEAFRKIPFHSCSQIYYSPQNVGPANLLYPEKTNMPAGMVCGIPYDDLKKWCGIYPPEILEKAFMQSSEEWGTALEKLRSLKTILPKESGSAYHDLWTRAEATYCCLRSTACQIAFIRLRDAGKLQETCSLVDEEIVLAKRLLAVTVSDSRIGFEAANHYFFGENELREKIIACEYLKTHECFAFTKKA